MPPDIAPNRLDELVRSPFARLTRLLEGLDPALPAIDLSLGEPKALIPDFLGPTLEAHLAEFGRYPADQRHSRSPPGDRRLVGTPLSGARRAD